MAQPIRQVIDDGDLMYVSGIGRVSQADSSDVTPSCLTDGLGSTKNRMASWRVLILTLAILGLSVSCKEDVEQEFTLDDAAELLDFRFALPGVLPPGVEESPRVAYVVRVEEETEERIPYKLHLTYISNGGRILLITEHAVEKVLLWDGPLEVWNIRGIDVHIREFSGGLQAAFHYRGVLVQVDYWRREDQGLAELITNLRPAIESMIE